MHNPSEVLTNFWHSTYCNVNTCALETGREYRSSRPMACSFCVFKAAARNYQDWSLCPTGPVLRRRRRLLQGHWHGPLDRYICITSARVIPCSTSVCYSLRIKRRWAYTVGFSLAKRSQKQEYERASGEPAVGDSTAGRRQHCRQHSVQELAGKPATQFHCTPQPACAPNSVHCNGYAGAVYKDARSLRPWNVTRLCIGAQAHSLRTSGQLGPCRVLPSQVVLLLGPACMAS